MLKRPKRLDSGKHIPIPAQPKPEYEILLFSVGMKISGDSIAKTIE